MIVYEIHIAFNKYRDHKYAPLYECDSKQSLFLRRWQFLGPHFHGPFTRENWTKPYGDVWPANGLPMQYDGKKRRADCDYASNFIVYSEKAVNLLGNYLDVKYGEFLPMLCDERSDLQIFRCMNCLDALDRKNTIPFLRNDEEFHGWDTMKKEFNILENVDIDKFVFREEVIGNNIMFILPCHLDTGTFVTDKFVERFREKKLQGLGFRPVWSSERGPLSEYPLQRHTIYDDYPDLNF